MKKTGFVMLLATFLLLFILGGSRAETKDWGKMTLMIYMCGSNLESGYGTASNDLMEMVQNAPTDDGVTVLIMTGGSSRWVMGFADGKTQIHEIGRRGMRTVWPAAGEESVSMNMGDPGTLTTFLKYGKDNYPANKYALILWDHGGGPMTGVCWDEVYSMDNLSIEDVAQALKDAGFNYSKLEWIGFDACLMGTLEVACMMAPYARYMIASEEMEPALGWNYSFLKDLETDPDGSETGHRIADAFFAAADGKGDELTISCIDLSGMTLLCQSLDRLFSPLASELSEDNFTEASILRMRTVSFGKTNVDGGDNAYDLVDLGDLIRHMNSTETESALAALDSAVVYSRSNVEGATGLSVYFPYRNKTQYVTSWHDSYRFIRSSSGFADYIFRFGNLLTSDERTDWSGLKARIEGPDPKSEGYIYACDLTEEQAASLVSARMLVLLPYEGNNGVDDSYALVGDYPAELGEDNVLRTTYNGQLLYIVVSEDNTDQVVGPLGYHWLSDMSVRALPVILQPMESAILQEVDYAVFLFDIPEEGNAVSIQRVMMMDTATNTFSNRIAYDSSLYSILTFMSFYQVVPPNNENGTLPAFRDWSNHFSNFMWNGIRNVPNWHLQFFDQSSIAGKPVILFEVIDVQQNSFCSSIIPMYNPALTAVGVTTGAVETDQYRVNLIAEMVNSALNQYLSLEFTVTNKTATEIKYRIEDIRLNGTRMTNRSDQIKLNPGETKKMTINIYPDELTGMTDLSWLKATLIAEPQPDGEETETELSFGLDHVEVSQITERYSPLAVAEKNGVTWELLDFETDENGDLKLLFHITNNREQEIKTDIFPLLAVNGIQSCATGSFEVSPGCDKIRLITLRDSVLLGSSDRIEVQDQISFMRDGVLSRQLQLRHGYNSLESVSLAYKIKAGQWESEREMVSMHLKLQPVIPDFTPTNQNERWYGPVMSTNASDVRLLPLLNWPQAGVWVERILVGDNGLAAALEIENRSDQFINLRVTVVAINGEPVSGSEERYEIMPGCILCDALPFETNVDRISSVTLQIHGLRIDRDPEIEIVFSSPARLGARGGTVLDAGGMTAEMPAAPAKVKNTLVQTGVRYLGEQFHTASAEDGKWYNCFDGGHSFVLWPDGTSQIILFGDHVYDNYAWLAKEDGSISLFNTEYGSFGYSLYADGEWIVMENNENHTCYRFKPEE